MRATAGGATLPQAGKTATAGVILPLAGGTGAMETGATPPPVGKTAAAGAIRPPVGGTAAAGAIPVESKNKMTERPMGGDPFRRRAANCLKDALTEKRGGYGDI